MWCVLVPQTKRRCVPEYEIQTEQTANFYFFNVSHPEQLEKHFTKDALQRNYVVILFL